MTPAGAAARDAGVYMYSRVGSAIIQLGAFALAARAYGDQAFGYLQIALTVYLVGIALGSLGLPDVVFYYLGRQPGQGPAIVRRSTFLLAAMIVPVVLGAAVMVYTASGKTDVRPFFPWLVAMLALELPAQPAVNLMIATGHARLASGIYVTFGLLRAVAVLVPALLGGSVEHAVIALTGASLARLVLYAWLVRVYFPGGRGWWDKAALRHMLAYAAPGGLAAVGHVINAQIDKYVIGYLLGPAAAGQYGVATYELPLVTLVPYAAAAVLQPLYVQLFAGGQRRELRELWLAMVRKVSLAVLPLAVLFLALADQLLPLVFSADYREATTPFRIYLLLLLHRVAAYGNILQALDRPRVVLVSSAILVLSNAMLTVPLTLWLGFPGAALATVLATVPSWYFVLGQIAEGMEVGRRHVMPWRHYLGVLGVAAPVGAGVYLLVDTLRLSAGVEAALGAAVYTLAVVVGLRATGLMDRADAAYVRDWLTLRLLRRRVTKATAS